MSDATAESNPSGSEPVVTAIVFPYILLKTDSGTDIQPVVAGAFYDYHDSRDGSTTAQPDLSRQALQEGKIDNSGYSKMFCQLFLSERIIDLS